MIDCIFCKIVKGESPSSKIYEDNDFVAFMDIKPVNKGHVLIIPKNHVVLVSEMSEKSLGKMMIIGEKLNTAIRKSKIKCEGINFFLADGEAAGQEVFHVHLHVIPRFKDDGFGFKFPKGYENKPNRIEIEEVASKIKLCM
jgi:histidine triad (HIT) family protein